MAEDQPVLDEEHHPDTPGEDNPLCPIYSAIDPLAAQFLHSPFSHHFPRLPQTIAHRGYKGTFPENTLLAIERAIHDGAQALELDLHLSRDGVVVLSHVSEAAPSCGTILTRRRMRLCNGASAAKRRSLTVTGLS